jgi:peptide subunit release factor 1 (eRF1)
MATVSAETVRRLAAFDAGGAPVTTCNLDDDGRRHPTHLDVQRELDVAVRRARLNGNHDRSVDADLDRISRFVRGLDRHGVRGLAMFASSGANWFEAHVLPVTITTQVVVNRRADVRQLEEVLERHEPLGLLLVDRQRARMFVFSMGELAEHTEQVDSIERHGADDRGELVKTRVAAQLDEQVQQHLRRSARLVAAVRGEHPFRGLVLAGPPDAVSGVESHLRVDLASLVVQRMHLAVSAPLDQVREAALEASERSERQVEADAVALLRSEVGAHRRGVAGLASTLTALAAGRVQRLFVSRGYEAEGWRCDGCGRLATVGRRCPDCGAGMAHTTDVVAEAVDDALVRGASVLTCLGNADLDVLGRVGAILRY